MPVDPEKPSPSTPGDHPSPALVPLVFILSGETDAAAATLVAACSSQA